MIKKLDKEYFDQKVELLSPKKVMSLPHDSKLSQVLEIMQKHKFGSLILTKKGLIHAIITEKDFLFKIGNNYSEVKDKLALEFSTKRPFHISKNDSITTCMTLMTSLAIRHVPVVDETDIAMLSINDVLKFLIAH